MFIFPSFLLRFAQCFNSLAIQPETGMEEHHDDRIQRSLNESKKRELEEKYGASFPEGDSKTPPEIESQFLQHVEQFELQYQNAERMTISQFIGNPTFKRLPEVPPTHLKAELEKVLECLKEHNVEIDFLSNVPIEERYRFITEELVKQETDDIRIDGMTHHFIYEDFHPNDQHDAETFAEDFLLFLLGGDVKFAMNAFSKEELLDEAGAPSTLSVTEDRIREFTGRIMTFIEKDIEIAGCEVEGDYATVSLSVAWDGLMADTLTRRTFSGIARLKLKRSPYGGWDVVQAIVPGWNA